MHIFLAICYVMSGLALTPHYKGFSEQGKLFFNIAFPWCWIFARFWDSWSRGAKSFWHYLGHVLTFASLVVPVAGAITWTCFGSEGEFGERLIGSVIFALMAIGAATWFLESNGLLR